MKPSRIGTVGKDVKIASGLFWADYGHLAATVEELEAGGADWIHMEMRDGDYMGFQAPRGGLDILMGIRPVTNIEIEVQLQMTRPSLDLLKQLADEGADLITLPIETTGETLLQYVTYVKDLGLKAGVWAWQGCPVLFFDQYIPFVDIIEYECRYPFWKPVKGGGSPHVVDPIVVESVGSLYEMLVKRGREKEVDLMEDGGLNRSNLEPFVSRGMNVGEFSSPLLKGPEGRFKPGEGKIAAAVGDMKQYLTELANHYRNDDGTLK
jgi:ribulose-phosphate 3-epimerase